MNIKEELKKLKKTANGFLNSDYATGYISALSTVEGIITETEEKYKRHDLRKNPDDLPIYDKQYICLIERMPVFVYETRPRLEYCTLTRCQIMNLKEFVIAWREIEPFEVEL